MPSSFLLKNAVSAEPDLATRDTRVGFLKTEGNQIVDATTGEVVRLVGVNWFGAESATLVPNGLWAENYMNMMDQMAEAGFNTIRLPISPAVLTEVGVTDSIRQDLNPDLYGKKPLEILDRIVAYASDVGIRVILDMHRIDPGVGKQENGLWYNDNYSTADLAADWKTIAGHFKGNPTVVGVDLFNEPSGAARWGDEATDVRNEWSEAATLLGNAVLSANPNLLVLVEGVHIHDNKWYWVGGNLKGVAEDPVHLDVPNRVVYSPHDYPSSVHNVPWLKDVTSEQMLQNFKSHWGFIYDQGIAPVLIGETGARMADAADTQYMDTLFAYLKQSINASPGDAGGIGVTWWSWNPNSHNTGGILADDWRTIQSDKLAYLQSLQPSSLPADLDAAAAQQASTLTFELARTGKMEKWGSFSYSIVGGTATEGVDFVGRDGIFLVRPGDTTITIDVKILPDTMAEPDETVILRIFRPDGKEVGSFEGVIHNTTMKSPIAALEMPALTSVATAIHGTLADDALKAGRDGSVLHGLGGNDNLRGGKSNDHLIGGVGDDFLRGGGGDDFCNGGSGNDRLNGGAGNDTLVGGSGADIFIFDGALQAGSGRDDIKDFELETDRLQIINAKIVGAAQNGEDVTLSFSTGGSLIVRNVLLSELDASCFLGHQTYFH